MREWIAKAWAFDQGKRVPATRSEGFYVWSESRLRDWSDRGSKQNRFGKDCVKCCAIGLCHWDALKPSAAAMFRVADGLTYRACAPHMEMLLRRSMNIGEQYDDHAHTPAILKYATEGR